MDIKLIDHLNGERVIFGSIKGSQIYSRIRTLVHDSLDDVPIKVNIEGIESVDVTFVRESLGSLVSFFKGRKNFVLINPQQRLSNNWIMGLHAKNLSMVVLNNQVIDYVGKPVSESNKLLLNKVRSMGLVCSADIAHAMSLTIQNASTRLKGLTTEGLLMRNEVKSLSGGKEYSYKALI